MVPGDSSFKPVKLSPSVEQGSDDAGMAEPVIDELFDPIHTAEFLEHAHSENLRMRAELRK